MRKTCPTDSSSRPTIITYKYRIKDRNSRKSLAKHAYAANQVWNWCVAREQDQHARYLAGAPKRTSAHFDLTRQCKGVGAELGIHQQTVNEVCKQFIHSRDLGNRMPGFRASYGQKRSLGWIPFQRQSRQIDGNSITYLGKQYRFWEGRRPLPQTAKGGAFIEDTLGRWYIVFHIEIEDRAWTQSGEIGIDLGLKAFAVTNAGEIIENPRHFNCHAQKLSIAQRSGNKRRVRAIHARIANVRRDFHHKLSTRLCREHAFIAVGNVSAKRLAKTKMAKSAFDAGWSSFRAMLRYKATTFVEVNEKFTTQTCSSCGALPPERPKGIAGLGIREWDCSSCGVSHDRDVNAARNILALARSAPRLGEESRRIVQ